MDYETKILLHRLVEEVEKLNSPDWWIIGITVVNALIMAWLGWRQYKLQQKQTKQQEQQILQEEYDIYSKLYKLVKRADVEIDYFLDEIIEKIALISCEKTVHIFLQQKQDYLEQLRNDLEQNSINFEIKFSKEFFDLNGYRNILGFMVYNLKSLVKMIDDKKMVFIKTYSQIIDSVDDSIEKGKAYYIAQHIKDEQYKVIIGSNLLSFVERRNKLRENSNDILAKIRERCKIE